MTMHVLVSKHLSVCAAGHKEHVSVHCCAVVEGSLGAGQHNDRAAFKGHVLELDLCCISVAYDVCSSSYTAVPLSRVRFVSTTKQQRGTRDRCIYAFSMEIALT